MDRWLIERKLESLRRCLARVQEKCPPSAAELAQDLDAQDILVLNRTRAVQLCVDIALHLLSEQESPPPQSMGGAFEQLARLGLIPQELANRLKKAVGFRNVAVHSYQEIDWVIVHAIATRHLDDFKAFAAAVSKHLEPGAQARK